MGHGVGPRKRAPRVTPGDRAWVMAKLEKELGKELSSARCALVWDRIRQGEALDKRQLARALRSWNEPLPPHVRAYVSDLIEGKITPVVQSSSSFLQAWTELPHAWSAMVVGMIEHWRDIFTRVYPVGAGKHKHMLRDSVPDRQMYEALLREVGQLRTAAPLRAAFAVVAKKTGMTISTIDRKYWQVRNRQPL